MVMSTVTDWGGRVDTGVLTASSLRRITNSEEGPLLLVFGKDVLSKNLVMGGRDEIKGCDSGKELRHRGVSAMDETDARTMVF
ncbi:unnamed protein product [Dovyalis caffra]|uniref:Uncharacterized protein n=1 Tax=Dovyalis caffra TaxID=77055 RepID=A0AAV1SKU7_9ROSI|nr:unnamed protein product [Dovyalis caffra]